MRPNRIVVPVRRPSATFGSHSFQGVESSKKVIGTDTVNSANGRIFDGAFSVRHWQRSACREPLPCPDLRECRAEFNSQTLAFLQRQIG